MHVVILAGGGGTRLWPLSSPARPKPFLPLLGDETLFQGTVRRLLEGTELPGLSAADITTVTDRRYTHLVRAQVPGTRVLEEPVGRNTAAAIALAAEVIDRPDDEVMVVLPADHLIEPARASAFRRLLGVAADELARTAFGIDAPLVTIGVAVDRPATEYGYLRPVRESGARLGDVETYPLRSFVEKPSPDVAEGLQREPGIAWNAGMFLWQRRAIRGALDAYAPALVREIRTGLRSGDLPAAYERIGRDVEVRRLSIDYLVMEPAAADRRVVMATMDVGWSDLGSWDALLGALGVAGTGRVVPAGEAVTVHADDLVVRRRGGRLRLDRGPTRGILDADGPSALLMGARPFEATVGALLERVDREEAQS